MLTGADAAQAFFALREMWGEDGNASKRARRADQAGA